MDIIQAQNTQWPHFLKRDEATLHGGLGGLYLKSEKKNDIKRMQDEVLEMEMKSEKQRGKKS